MVLVLTGFGFASGMTVMMRVMMTTVEGAGMVIVVVVETMAIVAVGEAMKAVAVAADEETTAAARERTRKITPGVRTMEGGLPR